MKMLIFGCGFSGLQIGKRLAAKSHQVVGTTRARAKFARLKEVGIAPVEFDGVSLTPEIIAEMADVTHLLISIAPPREESTSANSQPVDPVLAALNDQELLALMPDLVWIGYLSTVGVYGNQDGRWIDEQAELQPTSARSRQRVRAEGEWGDAARTSDLPLCIMRLSGIYGPERNALRAANEGRSRRLIKKDQVFNRIHVGDIAGAVDLASARQQAGIFNITDDEPAPPQDVVTFAHSLLASDPPPEIDFESAELTPMARSFYGDNKRVSNAFSKSAFNMEYRWPNYRVALQRMHDEKDW